MIKMSQSAREKLGSYCKEKSKDLVRAWWVVVGYELHHISLFFLFEIIA